MAEEAESFSRSGSRMEVMAMAARAVAPGRPGTTRLTSANLAQEELDAEIISASGQEYQPPQRNDTSAKVKKPARYRTGCPPRLVREAARESFARRETLSNLP
jgi:hypothetical protein